MKNDPSQRRPNARQMLILGVFGGLFWFAWAVGCYQTVYLQEVGFSASQLGLLNAISSVAAIAAVTFWGMVSDKIGSLRKVLIAVMIVGCTLFAMTPLVPTALPFSTTLLMVYLPVVNFFRNPQNFFAENLLVRNSSEIGLHYGILRGLASLLFTVGSIGSSLCLPFIGVRNTFWIAGLLMVPAMGLVLMAREPDARGEKARQAGKRQELHVSELFKNRRYLVLLLFASLFYTANACSLAFPPYFMESIGVSSELCGVLLGYRALLEIPFLILMVHLRRRIPLRYMLAIAALAMATEGLGYGLFADSLGDMILFSTLYGLGNGLFIGSSLNYVYELAPDHLKASAHAFYTATSAVAGILGNLLGGMLYDAIGPHPFYLAVSGIYLLSAAVLAVSFIHRKQKPAAA